MQRLANIVQLCVAWCNLESSGVGRWRRDRAEEVDEGGAQGDEDEREGKRERKRSRGR